jgi:hypothetical protein
MRRLLPVLSVCACLFLLGACAGVPAPENEQSTLVIGSFILDYPDGLFDFAARTVASGVYLTVKNNTKGSSFTMRTTEGGYFYFLSNGSDSYSLVGYRYEFTAAGRQEYTMRGGIGGNFTVVPGQVCYLGDIVFRQTKPTKGEEGMYAGTKQTSWQYETTATRDDKRGQAVDFLRKQDPQSPWLSRMVAAVRLE